MWSSHTPRIVYWRLCSSCLHSVEFFSGTDHIVALCSVRKFLSFWLHGVLSANPTTSVLHRSAHLSCKHFLDFFGIILINKIPLVKIKFLQPLAWCGAGGRVICRVVLPCRIKVTSDLKVPSFFFQLNVPFPSLLTYSLYLSSLVSEVLTCMCK